MPTGLVRYQQSRQLPLGDFFLSPSAAPSRYSCRSGPLRAIPQNDSHSLTSSSWSAMLLSRARALLVSEPRNGTLARALQALSSFPSPYKTVSALSGSVVTTISTCLQKGKVHREAALSASQSVVRGWSQSRRSGRGQASPTTPPAWKEPWRSSLLRQHPEEAACLICLRCPIETAQIPHRLRVWGTQFRERGT